MRLTKGMYPRGSKPRSDAFNLRSGQTRPGHTMMAQKAGWYNMSAEKIGDGDLSAADFRRISEEIDAGEMFIVLSENDSSWALLPQSTYVAGKPQTRLTHEAPGLEYLAEKAIFIIVKDKLYHIERHEGSQDEVFEKHGLKFETLLPDAVKDFIAGGVPV